MANGTRHLLGSSVSLKKNSSSQLNSTQFARINILEGEGEIEVNKV
jgi:hypothetical protein